MTCATPSRAARQRAILPASRPDLSLRLFGLAAALLAALSLAPFAGLLTASIADTRSLWAHLARFVLPQAALNTALLLAGVGLVTGVIGVGLAYLVARFDFPLRRTISWMLVMPLAVPTYIVAYVYGDMLLALEGATGIRLGDIRTLSGGALLFGLVLYPYVYLATRTVFQSEAADLIESARVLGATRLHTLRRVTLPLAQPALAAGGALAMMETLNDVGASEYLGLGTLTLAVFATWLNRGDFAGAAQLSLLVLAAVALLVALEHWARRRMDYTLPAESPALIRRRKLAGARGIAAVAACALPCVFGFILPGGFLVGEVIRRGLAVDRAITDALLHSVTLAAIAALLVVPLAFVCVAALRWTRQRTLGWAAWLASPGYAVPGTILAIGLLGPVLLADRLIHALAAMVSLPFAGLLLMGSGGAIVIAYVIRFSAIAIGFSRAGLVRVPREYDDQARISGAATGAVLARIYLPLTSPSLLGALIVVFVDCLKELPATLLLRPLNLETLATLVYQHAGRGSFEEGALAALMIVAAGIVPVAWLARLADRREAEASAALRG